MRDVYEQLAEIERLASRPRSRYGYELEPYQRLRRIQEIAFYAIREHDIETCTKALRARAHTSVHTE